MTAKVAISTQDTGASFDIFSFKGNIRLPLPSGEYVVIEGEIGVGFQLEVGLPRFEIGVGPSGGVGIYVSE